MDVRQADFAADYEACAALSSAVQTTHVWQVRLAYDPIATQVSQELGATLSLTRLPRPVTVRPASAEPLDVLWSRAAEVLLVEDAGGIIGYVALTNIERVPTATLARLVVAPAARRTGVGGLLVQSAAQWARAVGFEALAAHCSARNYPASSFYMRWGLRFAGYSESFYPRSETALFWHRAV